MHALINAVGWRRNGRSRLAPLLLVLGVCVFAWGLRYKLSLYHPPHSISRRIACAKLLSKNEQTDAELHVALGLSGLRPNQPEVSPPAVYDTLQREADLSPTAVAYRAMTAPAATRHSLERAGLYTWYFRPPPPLA